MYLKLALFLFKRSHIIFTVPKLSGINIFILISCPLTFWFIINYIESQTHFEAYNSIWKMADMLRNEVNIQNPIDSTAFCGKKDPMNEKLPYE